jgi:chaperone modulatory protein CbpM
MTPGDPLSGVLLDDSALSVDQLARACEVDVDWVVRHVQAGVLGGDAGAASGHYRFRSADLVRARLLASLERDFDANEEIAALVIDLGDEIRRLRTRLRVLGLD